MVTKNFNSGKPKKIDYVNQPELSQISVFVGTGGGSFVDYRRDGFIDYRLMETFRRAKWHSD